MKKETVLILLLLKPMTETSQLNDVPIMIYHGGCPVLRISIPCFLPLFWWKSHEIHENRKKEIVLVLKPMTKTSQLNGKSRQDVFRRVLSTKKPLKVAAWRCLFMDCKSLLK